MDDPASHNRVMRFFSYPLVGMIGTAASVIGLAFGLIVYLSEHRTRDLTAFVHPIRTNVVRMGQASKLSVKIEDRLIDSDVTAVQIAVWNRGALGIRPSNVLKPVAIVMPGRQVLEATIRKQSRDVVNLRLDSTKLAEGRVPLNWDILEQGDGAIIQLIYAGDEKTDINIEGVLEGQPSVSRLEYSRKLQRPEDQFSGYNWSSIFVGILCCIMSSVLLIINMIAYFCHGLGHRSRLILLTVGCLSGFALGSYIVYGALTCFGPPFGF